MSYINKIFQQFVDYSTQISILILIFAYIIFTNDTSFVQYSFIGFICVSLIVWATIDNVQDIIPKQPISYLFVSIFLTQLLTYHRLTMAYTASNLFETIFVVLFSIVTGFVLWHISMVIIAGLIASTTDISFDIDNNIDDPYGDKHAARILNDTND